MTSRSLHLPITPTIYAYVSAYLEVFGGYLWPVACHNYSPQQGEWKVPRHSGLKEFVDQMIVLIGRDQVKPTTMCVFMELQPTQRVT